MYDFWTLPGPASFVARICTELSKGRNVALRVPQYFPSGFDSALRRATEENWAWNTIADHSEGTVAISTVQQLTGSIPPNGISPHAHIAQYLDFQGGIGWIQDVKLAFASDWSEFLSEYEHACREVHESRRGLFVVVFKGDSASHAPSEEVALSLLTWDDWVSELDMLLYASRLVVERGATKGARATLLSTCIARLAVGDPYVAQLLADETPERLLEPIPILADIAASRGWNKDTSCSWEQGTLHTVDGRPRDHSAIAAVSDNSAEVWRRIWSAQASVLLPILEEKRIALVRKHRRFIQLPIVTKYDSINSLEDVELGHLARQLEMNRADSRTRQVAFKLRAIRNKLAHLEPLPPHLAFDPELLG